MPTNTIQRKLQQQINNLARVLSNLDNQQAFLKQDLGYKSISRFTFSVRNNQLEQSKTNVEYTINFLQEFYDKAEGIVLNEFVGTKEIAKTN